MSSFASPNSRNGSSSGVDSTLLTSLPWTVDQVAMRLFHLGVLKDDVRILQSQDVDGESIAFLNDESLSRMGIPTFGRRMKIIRVVQSIIEKEAAKRGMKAPNVMGINATGASSAASADSPKDPYALPASRFSTSAAASNRFDNAVAIAAYDDDNLLDPATITPANSSNRSAYPPPSQPSRRSAGGGGGDRGNRFDPLALRQNDDQDVDRDRGREEAESNAASYDSDNERQFIHPRSASHRATFDPSSASASAASSYSNGMLAPIDTMTGDRLAIRPWLGSIVAPSRFPTNGNIGGIVGFNSSHPSKYLCLEWVHGYRAFDSRSNLFYNASSDIVYPVAGLCVVHRRNLKAQKFFMGHDDDVRCITQHPLDMNLIASGQNGGIKNGVQTPPKICVWDSSSSDLSRAYTLQCTLADKAIRSLAFSGGEGKWLASVSSDIHYSIKIWDWKKRILLTAAKVDSNPVFMVKGNPRDESEFVTVGKNHVLFWSFDGHTLKNKRATFAGTEDWNAKRRRAAAAASGDAEDVLSPLSFYAIAFSEKGYACLGAENGSIYVLVNGKVAKTFSGVHRGKILSLEWYKGGFVSGGSDGKVQVLDKKLDIIKSFQFSNKVTSVRIGGGGSTGNSNSSSGSSSQDSLLVGTQGSDVFEIRDFLDSDLTDNEDSLDAITRGHSDGELWGLAMAQDGRHFVTVGEDNTICLWSCGKNGHKLLKRGLISERNGYVLNSASSSSSSSAYRGGTRSTHPVNQCARSVAISPSGSDIVVGTNDGQLLVFDTRTFARKMTLDLTKYKKDLRHRGGVVDGRNNNMSSSGPGNNSHEHWITCLTFSPSGHALAAGTVGCVVCLIDTVGGYIVRSVLDKSISPLTSIDWNGDGTFISTNDESLDLKYYHVDEENLSIVSVVNNVTSMRDVIWATRSNTLCWSASGVTQPQHQGMFVNTTDANSSRTLIATGDDSGQVKLFRYPALPGATPLVYSGHSAHVTCARFSADEKFLVTTGGFDLSCCVWRVV